MTRASLGAHHETGLLPHDTTKLETNTEVEVVLFAEMRGGDLRYQMHELITAHSHQIEMYFEIQLVAILLEIFHRAIHHEVQKD